MDKFSMIFPKLCPICKSKLETHSSTISLPTEPAQYYLTRVCLSAQPSHFSISWEKPIISINNLMMELSNKRYIIYFHSNATYIIYNMDGKSIENKINCAPKIKDFRDINHILEKINFIQTFQ